MTAFYLFGEQLFVLYTWVGHAGLVLASAAAAALAFVLRQGPWARLAAAARQRARGAGALCAAAVLLALAAGLRVSGTTYDPSAPAMLWETLVALAAGAGLVATAWASGSGVAALVGGLEGRPALPAAVPLDPIEASVTAFLSLRSAVDRLRKAEQEATGRAQSVPDGVAAAEYVKAADAIRHHLTLAEELQSTTGAAVLRLACGTPVRRLLERRPDAVLAKLNDPKATGPLGARVDDAIAAVRAFMRDLEATRGVLRDELSGARGSVAARLGLDASVQAKPFDAALAQVEANYGRVGHRLEALHLRVGAEADAGAVAGAAMALTGQAPPPPKDLVEVALEMTQAEQSAVSALTALGAAPQRISEVVVHASAALARGSSDDEAMADVLRTVRRELES